jgi:hypothetical protein
MLSATAIAIGCHVAAWGVAALMLLHLQRPPAAAP